MSSLLGVFRNRRSVREYSPREVPDKVLLRVLEAAIWAPSAHNAQPWRFVVIRDPAVKRRLARAMADPWNRDMSKDGVPEGDRRGLIRASIERFTGSPVIILACLTMEDMEEYPDRRRREIEHVMAVQSVAAAIENVLLAAHLEGLGSCWFCAPLFCQGVVRRALNIPRCVEPQALITVGYPVEEPSPPPRKPLGKIVYQELWGFAG